jgi:hypothetical protein
LDQQAGANRPKDKGRKSLNSHARCIKVLDTRRTDLNHAYGVWHFSDDDRNRLNHAEKDLREFVQKWQNGKFDKGQLDGAIDAVQHVLDNNKMPVQERDVLSDDLSQLRKMREAHDRHEIEGDRH